MRSLTEPIAERFDPHQPRRPAPVERGLDRPHDRHARQPGIAGQPRDSSHHLAVEAGAVEAALAGDHEVGAVEVVVEIELVGDEFEAGNEPATECGQPAAEAPAAPLPSIVVTSTENSSRNICASRSSRPVSSFTCAGEAPFCGPKTSAACANGW